jgi:urease accessory protein
MGLSALSQDARQPLTHAFSQICEVQIMNVTGLSNLLASPRLLAHHPFGGNTPGNFLEGFLSGLGHPVIGLDHLAFVIAIGLIAAGLRHGWLMPLIFIVTAIAGTGLHLIGADLPQPELVIAGSVFLFGLFLAIGRPLWSPIVMVLAAVAGVFHGYAYGEAVVGAQMNPVAAYLLGFSLIQLAIAMGVYALAKGWYETKETLLNLRFIGFLLTGVGLAFTSGALLG